MKIHSIEKSFTNKNILKIDIQNFHSSWKATKIRHFSVVYTMKLSSNAYFIKCSERNISQCILALKQSHARVTSKDTVFIYSFISFLYLFPFFLKLYFISWISPPLSLFNWPRVQLYLKVSNHIYVLKWYVIHCLIYFGFIECL